MQATQTLPALEPRQATARPLAAPVACAAHAGAARRGSEGCRRVFHRGPALLPSGPLGRQRHSVPARRPRRAAVCAASSRGGYPRLADLFARPTCDRGGRAAPPRRGRGGGRAPRDVSWRENADAPCWVRQKGDAWRHGDGEEAWARYYRQLRGGPFVAVEASGLPQEFLSTLESLAAQGLARQPFFTPHGAVQGYSVYRLGLAQT